MAAGWKVLITVREFKDTGEAMTLLADAGCEVVPSKYGKAEGDHALGGRELSDLLEGVDAMIAGSAHLDRPVIEGASRLRIITRRGVGYENVDLQAAEDRGIAVAITAGINHEPVADHVMALLLTLGRRVVEGNDMVARKRFDALPGTLMRTATLGIIGLGRIGKAVALRARGFSTRVLATDPVVDTEFARRNGVEYVGLDRLLAESDFVSVNADLNPTSHHIIDAAALRKMKRSAVLINCARGPLVDEHALVDALRTGEIAAAGIDVYESEPADTTPLRGLPNAILTPHTAGYAPEAMRLQNIKAAQTVVDYMHGKLPEGDCLVLAPHGVTA